MPERECLGEKLGAAPAATAIELLLIEQVMDGLDQVVWADLGAEHSVRHLCLADPAFIEHHDLDMRAVADQSGGELVASGLRHAGSEDGDAEARIARELLQRVPQ